MCCPEPEQLKKQNKKTAVLLFGFFTVQWDYRYDQSYFADSPGTTKQSVLEFSPLEALTGGKDKEQKVNSSTGV